VGAVLDILRRGMLRARGGSRVYALGRAKRVGPELLRELNDRIPSLTRMNAR
jgi:hypothetical protein